MTATNIPDQVRWFERTVQKCQVCGKTATGVLRGPANESYGHHCDRCAERRLKKAEKERAAALRRGVNPP